MSETLFDLPDFEPTESVIELDYIRRRMSGAISLEGDEYMSGHRYSIPWEVKAIHTLSNEIHELKEEIKKLKGE